MSVPVTRINTTWYRVTTDIEVDKADPFAFHAEMPPRTASIVWDLDYEWHDQDWMAARSQRNSLSAPMSIYEIHLGSWRRVPEEDNRSLSYREMAPQLADYVQRDGLHPRRVPAADRASVLRLVGLSDDRLLCRRPAATARRRI